MRFKYFIHGPINVQKVLFGTSLMVVSLFAMLRNKETILSNCLCTNGNSILISERGADPSFESWTGIHLLEYLNWPGPPKSCEHVGYFGGKIKKIKAIEQAFMDGQKVVCLDKGTMPPLENCLIYSIGINDEWDFDEAMEAYGCQVYSFDPTMDKEEHNRTANIHFYPIGLSVRNEVLELGKGAQIKSLNMNSTTTSFKMMTLSSIYRMLSPIHGEGAIIDYLKFDIEGGEWNVIPELIKSGILEKVRQMGIEIHLTNESHQTLVELRENVKILSTLEEEGGMVRFDSKLNGLTKVTFKEMGNITGYFAYEMAWYNKKYHNN